MSDDPRYRAHALRAETLAGITSGAVAEYFRGYRQAMALTTGTPADPDLHATRTAIAERAVAGEEPDETRAAWGAGWYDGLRWDRPREHRGLVRLVIARAGGGSARGTARTVLGIDERGMRRILAGEQGLGAELHAELVDRLLASTDDARRTK